MFGYKQDVVAHHLGIHQTTYSRMEKVKKKDKIDPDVVDKLAELYNISPDDILNEKFVFNIQEQKGSNSNGLTINNASEKVVALYEEKIENLEARIKRQEARLERQEARIKAQDELIGTLQSQLAKQVY
ncbi:MAG: helix-turn-helix transcriptional regulator [Saprospiraceae bacterium]|nr:helix-turn-helix transcriptional regulator [Saprospiraceae bacterium]